MPMWRVNLEAAWLFARSIEGWLSTKILFDGSTDKLSGNTLDDMDDPEENLDDVGE